jgi:hypothetical protein
MERLWPRVKIRRPPPTSEAAPVETASTGFGGARVARSSWFGASDFTPPPEAPAATPKAEKKRSILRRLTKRRRRA